MSRVKTIAATLALGLAGAVRALAAEAPSQAPSPDLAGGVSQMLLALGLVLALVLALYWLARRFLPGATGLGQTPGLKVLGRLALGPKKGLVLVEVGQRVLVLGLGEQDITLLATIDDPAEVASLSAGVRGGFGRALKRAAGQEEAGQ